MKNLLQPLIILLSLFVSNLAYAQQDLDIKDQTILHEDIQAYGYSLFLNEGRSNQPYISDPNRTINYGDRILIRMWGAQSSEEIVMVDADGTIFLPEVGPVDIVGKTLTQAQEQIKTSISKIYKDNVGIHATMADIKPISIFVTGNVNTPGRYEGNQNDTVIDFILKAGGIISESGSYRNITVIRDTFPIAEIDLYDFLENGQMPYLKFRTGDTILVEEKKSTVFVAKGSLKNYSFEFLNENISGQEIINISNPKDSMSHVKIFRKDNKENKVVFQKIREFKNSILQSGDIIEFYNDTPKSTISVSVEGAIEVEGSYEVSKKTNLKELLSYIKVDSEIANLSAVHIERDSVARSQKKALEDSLLKLQQMKLTKQSETASEANIRTQEAEMINNLVNMSKNIEFDGKVVVMQDGNLNDILLENGDKIIIPKKNNLMY
jgi:protein involved in polysaccharide export with SLBB domain